MAESGKAEAAQGEKTQNPIVPYLQLPTAPGEKAYLAGVKCKSCGAAYLGNAGFGMELGFGPPIVLRWNMVYRTDFESLDEDLVHQVFLGWNY